MRRATCVLVVGMLVNVPAAAVACDFSRPTIEVASYRRVPAKIRAMIGDVGEPGSEWQATDAIDLSHPLPPMRLLRAGHGGSDWFAWWERGGIAHIWQAAAFRLDPGGKVRVLGRANIPVAWRNGGWAPAVDVCALVEGMLDGRYPPYPAPVTGAPLL